MRDGVLFVDGLRPKNIGDLYWPDFVIDPHLLPAVQDQVAIRQHLGNDSGNLQRDRLVALDHARTGVRCCAVDVQQAVRVDRFRQNRIQSTLITQLGDRVCVFVRCTRPGGLVLDIGLIIDCDLDGYNVTNLAGALIFE